MGSARVGSNPAADAKLLHQAPLVEWSNTLRSGRSPHLRAQVRILQGAPLLPRVPRMCVKPPWLSWQSARLLTDRSLVRAQVEALFAKGFLQVKVLIWA